MDTHDKSSRGYGNLLITVAAFIIIVAGLRAASSIVVPFLLSVFIAVICAQPLHWMRQRGIPAVIAIIILVVGLILVSFMMVSLMGNSVSDFSANLPTYDKRLDTIEESVRGWLQEKGVDAPENLLEYLNPQSAMKFVTGTISGVGGVLSNAFLILLIVIFILLEASSFPTKLRAMAGESSVVVAGFDMVFADIRRYMAAKTVTSFLTGLLVTIWLKILGVDFPVLWGLIAFLLNYVPNIGSIIAAIPAVILALIQLGVMKAVWTASGYLAVNLMIGTVLEPRIMGQRLGLSTLVVFLSLLFWGWVFGPVGMFLSAPLTMATKIALEGSEDTRGIAIMLGSESSARSMLQNASDESKVARCAEEKKPENDV